MGKKIREESADKPGSVLGSHSSGTCLTTCLVRPTREPCGPHVRDKARCPPIWSCSGRGLPCRFRCRKCGALLPHHFTLTQGARSSVGGIFSVALSVGSRPPGVTWRPVLRSPDFPPFRHDDRNSDCLADSLDECSEVLGAWLPCLEKIRRFEG